jgi:hypothetical protein
MRLHLSPWWLPFVSLLPGCDREEPILSTLHISTGAGINGCWVEAEGVRFPMEELPKRASAWRSRPVTINGGVEVPYKCIGGTIFGLQTAGITQIGFMSEPPARSEGDEGDPR